MKNVLFSGMLLACALPCHSKEYELAGKPGLSPHSYIGDRRRVHFMFGYVLGFDGSRMKIKDSAARGGGFMGQIELGTRIELPTQSDTRSAQVAISAAYVTAKFVKLQYGIVQVPLSYTSLDLGPDGESRGLYWQAGVNINYLGGAEHVSEPVMDATYNRVLLDPCIGFGVNGPFRVATTKGGQELAHGRVQVGLTFSYCFMNMLKNDASMHNYMVGLRYQFVFM